MNKKLKQADITLIGCGNAVTLTATDTATEPRASYALDKFKAEDQMSFKGNGKEYFVPFHAVDHIEVYVSEEPVEDRPNPYGCYAPNEFKWRASCLVNGYLDSADLPTDANGNPIAGLYNFTLEGTWERVGEPDKTQSGLSIYMSGETVTEAWHKIGGCGAQACTVNEELKLISCEYMC